MNFSDVDEGKANALFELSYHAAKEGGYQGEYIKDFQNVSKEYFIPMISALVGERLVTNENEFDELMYVIEQYSCKTVKDGLDLKEAKSGNKVEVLKFFAALAYEFRVTRPAMFTRFCESLSRFNQFNIAHFISYMDNATKWEDKDWWKVLFLPYSDEELNNLGVAICSSAIKTPRKTPSRQLLSEKSSLDSPVGLVINSPNGKDRLIHEYERRLQTERSLVQILQGDYETANTEITKLNVQVKSLTEKLEKAKKNATTTCGEECENKNELAAMRLRMKVRENKLQQLSAELLVARQELETVAETSNKFRVEKRQLEQQVEFLREENDRLNDVSNQIIELRQKMKQIDKEKEDLMVGQATNENLTSKVDQLTKQNTLLTEESNELNKQLSEMNSEVVSLKETVAEKNNLIEELNSKLSKIMTDELTEIRQTIKELENDVMQLKHENKNLADQVLEKNKETATLQESVKSKENRIRSLTTQLSKNYKSGISVRPKPFAEPTELVSKSFLKSTAFTVPFTDSLSTKMLSRPKPCIRTAPSSSAREIKYNEVNRAEVLRDRNSKSQPHMRSHYATELDNNFSPSKII